jgi:hypothetical protein
MKRVYLLAAGLLAFAAPACHRDNCAGTTNTTSATVTPAPAQPELTSAELSGAPSTDATAGPVAGTTATATPAPVAATTAMATPARAAPTATAPVDISGPSPAAPTTAAATTVVPAPFANTPAASTTTTTTGAPLVAPGLDNAVSGGASNTGAPFNYGSPYDNTVYGGGGPAPMTTSRPVGGPMRPGAASNPDTTSGAR